VTRERYDVPALFDANARYGRRNPAGIAVYAVGVLVQMPFVAIGFYTGRWVDALGGVDILWIVGIIVPGALYYAVTRLVRPRVPTQLILPDTVGDACTSIARHRAFALQSHPGPDPACAARRALSSGER